MQVHAQHADPRLALVIGNADYKSAPLKNPVNDARAVARALKDLGFEVMLKENLSQPGFMAALREFGTRLKQDNATGLFYYAGHGMQVKGANYLIPVDAAIEGEDEIKYLAIDANQVLDKMEQAGNRLNIVILDACRDNPFARSFRSKQSGLAQMDAPSGMLIAFATAPGSVAYDGDGVNGVYTKHLLRNLTLPGLPVELVLKRVREGVAKDTDNKQIPWESSSLLGDFYFKTAAVQSSAPVQPDAAALELAFWNAVKDSAAAGEYRAYLEQYPDGKFAPLARARVNAAPAPVTTGNTAPSDAPAQVALAQPSSVKSPRPRSLVRKGDNWTYNLMDGGKRKVGTVIIAVTGTDAEQVTEYLTHEGVRTIGKSRDFRAGFDPTAPFRELELPGKYFLVEFSPYVAASDLPKLGQDWKDLEAELTVKGEGFYRVRTKLNVRVLSEEYVEVPAGRFSTLRIEARSRPQIDVRNGGNSHMLILTYWYSPELRRTVKMSWREQSTFNRNNSEDTFELARYRPGE